MYNHQQIQLAISILKSDARLPAFVHQELIWVWEKYISGIALGCNENELLDTAIQLVLERQLEG
ncbi:hypothetical protein Pse7367_3929 (plasmid) [Thalassoporum mexicanum PCC 7367]|uniref:hypothetical protein n=1 Tax=Thalassoporum mexicanum TaxID=3457544 RepID=UPI00029FCACA|nr:hypothetical protein [Pseudanabaena sp. PCC 7367]AFY72145.1 hypothetical protein Pse7367_3929 [Pseudanabaena sp. PCC 7367]